MAVACLHSLAWPLSAWDLAIALQTSLSPLRRPSLPGCPPVVWPHSAIGSAFSLGHVFIRTLSPWSLPPSWALPEKRGLKPSTHPLGGPEQEGKQRVTSPPVSQQKEAKWPEAGGVISPSNFILYFLCSKAMILQKEFAHIKMCLDECMT